jgi:hypothetical protein
MKKNLILNITACCCLLLLLSGGCKEDHPAPTLEVDETEIAAEAAAGSYTIAVTSNTAWTASVNSSATWCDLSPASATGNGTVTVNVVENPATVTRSATVTIAAGSVSQTVDITQDACTPLPPDAASTRTWIIGNQTWSDHINVPACFKSSYNGGTADAPRADCRNDPDYSYLYSWQYVHDHASTLCPAPWRVPTREDFMAVVDVLGSNFTTSQYGWSLGGYCGIAGTIYSNDSRGYYWSSTEYSATVGYDANFSSHDMTPQASMGKINGMSLRCVR